MTGGPAQGAWGLPGTAGLWDGVAGALCDGTPAPAEGGNGEEHEPCL